MHIRQLGISAICAAISALACGTSDGAGDEQPLDAAPGVDATVDVVEAELECLAPCAFVFGPGFQDVQRVTLRNTGESELQFGALRVVGLDGFRFDSELTLSPADPTDPGRRWEQESGSYDEFTPALVLEGGAELEVALAVGEAGGGCRSEPQVGTMVVETAGLEPATSIPIELPPPGSIHVEPPFVAFPPPVIGATHDASLAIQNLGGTEIAVTSLDFTDVIAGLSLENLDGQNTPFLLGPDDATAYRLRYIPEDEDAFSTTLRISSSDVCSPVVLATITVAGPDD